MVTRKSAKFFAGYTYASVVFAFLLVADTLFHVAAVQDKTSVVSISGFYQKELHTTLFKNLNTVVRYLFFCFCRRCLPPTSSPHFRQDVGFQQVESLAKHPAFLQITTPRLEAFWFNLRECFSRDLAIKVDDSYFTFCTMTKMSTKTTKVPQI